MRVVGKRKTQAITNNASGYLLKQGAVFNDELHRLPTGNTTYFPKGIYRYKTHEAANTHWEFYLTKGMVKNGQ